MKRIVIHSQADCQRLSDPKYQLAIDEAALAAAEDGQIGSTLRSWELQTSAVILGRSSRVDFETDREFCDAKGIGLYRRCSGGAAIVGGPGCFMYSIVLSLKQYPDAAKIDQAHHVVMTRVLSAIRRQLPAAELNGICDLTFHNRKFSGNALRVARNHLLYHGTILYRADLDLIQACLAHAPRQPDYRSGRDHGSFLTNAPVDAARFDADLADEFGMVGQVDLAVFSKFAERLMADRYGRADWHLRH